MQARKKTTWDPSRFRRQHMTFWPRTHPVMFPHLCTDHWTKMKVMVPTHIGSIPSALATEKDAQVNPGQVTLNWTSSSFLPPLTQGTADPAANDPALSMTQDTYHNTPKASSSPRNLPQYRNEYNDRARRDFCYWLIENKAPKCQGYSFGTYKTSLGLPRV